MPDPTSTPGPSRALFLATAPAVSLAVAVLGPVALWGVVAGTSGVPAIAAIAGIGLAGLAGLVRLWAATWGSRDAPAWAVAASVAGILLGIGSLANLLAARGSIPGGDGLASWLLPTAVIVAQLGALVLLASRWTPPLREAWRRPASAAVATLVVLGATGAVLARAPSLLHAAALRNAAMHVDEVVTDHHDPFVEALCGGRLDEARSLIATHQVRAQAQYGLVECLEHGADAQHPARTFYPERVGPLLDGLVAAQRAAGAADPEGCTPGLVRVIRTLASDHPDALREFGPRHLPVDCIDLSAGQPAWWSLVGIRDGRPLAERLRVLQAQGIDPRQRTAAGVDLLGANVNHVIASLTDDDLANVIAMGLHPEVTALRTRPFAVELAERRFSARAKRDPAALDELIARYGEPSVEQLLTAADLGQATMSDFTPQWDDYLRERLKGIGPERIAGTALDSAPLRFQLRWLACARDHACEGRLGNLPPPPPPAAAPGEATPPDPALVETLARRDYRFRVIKLENAARAAAAVSALEQHHSFEEVLYRYGMELPRPELARVATWTAGSTLPATTLVALGALSAGEQSRTPLWQDGRFLVLRLEESRPRP